MKMDDEEALNQLNDEKELSKENKAFSRIFENYLYMNQMMVQEMELASEHPGLTGGYREGMWLKFFRNIIPLKYSIAQGVIIIDSHRNVSNEVDIAVFDEQYTPYVFQYNTLKFIPIEAVVLVVECKSKGYNPDALKEWSDSISKLIPNPSGVARIVSGYATGLTNTAQTKTRPIKVLASMKVTVKQDTRVETAEKLKDHFDFVIEEKTGKNIEEKTLEVIVRNEEKSLGWWGRELNTGNGGDEGLYLEIERLDGSRDLSPSKLEEYRSLKRNQLKDVHPELTFTDDLKLTNKLSDLKVINNPLLTLNMQINQLLMLLNNPMMFPHLAYARAFNEWKKNFG